MNPLVHELFQKTRFLTKQINKTLEKYGLFASQWSVLYCIDRHEEMTLTEIWKYLNVEAPTITRTVNRLEQLGWVQTSAGLDRREKIVRLSDKAIVELPKIKDAIAAFEKNAVLHLTEEEQALLMKLLRKINTEGSISF